MLEIAVLGLLGESPMHGYELRKRLSTLLGTFRAFSYGSLYPTLRRLAEAGWISEETPDGSTGGRSRRGKRVYQLTAEGKERLAELLADVGPDAYADVAHLSSFSSDHWVSVLRSGLVSVCSRSMSSLSHRTSRSADSRPCSCSWSV